VKRLIKTPRKVFETRILINQHKEDMPVISKIHIAIFWEKLAGSFLLRNLPKPLTKMPSNALRLQQEPITHASIASLLNKKPNTSLLPMLAMCLHVFLALIA
jgi:hypothetical protein